MPLWRLELCDTHSMTCPACATLPVLEPVQELGGVGGGEGMMQVDQLLSSVA